MKRTLTITLDADWLYRRVIPKVLIRVFTVIWRIDGQVRGQIKQGISNSIGYLSPRSNLLGGILSKQFPLGNMVMWVALILAIYLMLSIFS